MPPEVSSPSNLPQGAPRPLLKNPARWLLAMALVCFWLSFFLLGLPVPDWAHPIGGWVICLLAIYLARRHWQMGEGRRALIMIGVAIVRNPFGLIGFDQVEWRVVDLGTGIVLLILGIIEYLQPEEENRKK